MRFLRKIVVLLLATAASGCAHLAASNPNALWMIVDHQCVPATKTSGGPGACTAVDLAQRYAILKDINGNTQYLLIPTDRVSGIESPSILEPDAPDYWVDAWNARHYVEKRLDLGLPHDQIGLEINSEFRRSQSQLHIHIDCMQRHIVDALAAHRDDVLDKWRWTTLDGQRYRVMRVATLSGENDPFRVVARDRQGPDAMANQTILVTGAGPSNKDGWLIVNSGLNIEGGSGTAEDLLDHACRIAMHG